MIMKQVGVSRDQQDRMVKIRDSHNDDFASAGRRLRQAQRGLDEAMMSPQFNEAEVNRRIEDLAQANADRVRLQQRMRAEMRQVLTPEQVMKFNQVQRELQQKQQELKRIEMLQTSPDKSPSGDQNQNQTSQAPVLDMLDVFIARDE
jgi:Spy/CpxP family protein refolding chaperone